MASRPSGIEHILKSLSISTNIAEYILLIATMSGRQIIKVIEKTFNFFAEMKKSYSFLNYFT